MSKLTEVAYEDTQLGKYSILVGVQLMIRQMLLHHDPELWVDDMMEFKPGRISEGILKAAKLQGSQGCALARALQSWRQKCQWH